MRLTHCHDNEAQSNIHILSKAIHSFNGAASRLENYYQHLEHRIQQLSEELLDKKEELNRQVEEKEEAQAYVHNVMECLPVGVIAIDLQGAVTIMNRVAESLTGVDAETACGRPFDEVLASMVFGRCGVALNMFDEVFQRQECDADIVRENEVIQVRISVSCLRDQQGGKVGMLLTMQDITEVKKLERQATRNNRLAAMGEMAAKMAHEIRNPLGSIELFVSVLKRELSGNEEAAKIAERISSGVRSINTIISNLLLFMRPHQNVSLKVIDIHEPLKDSLFFSSHVVQSNENIRVSADFGDRPLMVQGDGELLKQVFLNLILNAIQAIPTKGQVSISTGIAEGTDKENGREKKGRTRKYAFVRFADTGIGIPREYMTKIFDPFFTTKTRGTGLGLPIVHNIIKSHGGTIDIESIEGSGTECVVALPLSQ